MHSRIQFRFTLHGLLTLCLAAALLVATSAPRQLAELEVDVATLNRIDHSSKPLDPDAPFEPAKFSDVTTKGWPATAYLSHRAPFASVAAAISGTPVKTRESYIDWRGVAINALVAAMALIICYLVRHHNLLRSRA